MNKCRLVLFLLTLLLTFNVQAYWQGEALAGLSVDYARYDGRYDIGLFYTGFPAVPQTNYQDRQRNSGFGGGALVGYQFICNDWVLGAELSADWFDINKERVFVFTDQRSALAWDTGLQARNKGFYGLSTRVGYYMAPFFMSYVRVGVEAVHQQITARFNGAPGVYPFGLTLKDDSWQNHVYVGVGAEFPLPLFCQLSLRMEYNYHFPSATLRGGGRILDGIVNPTFSIEARPSIDTGKVSLIWNF